MKCRAYAKVNLSLDVLGVRDDGYHLLSMIMQCIDLYDEIEIKEKESGIKIYCSDSKIPTDKRNLAYKAAEIFMERYQINKGVEIYIEKNIPSEAGLGGGSSDGASVLKLMRELFKPEVSNEELAALGERLGADVPFFIYGGTALCEGIGEIITPLKNFSNHRLVLVKPSFGASTKEVYEEIDKKILEKRPKTDLIIEHINNNELECLCNSMVNVLESVTIEKYPVLKDIKHKMRELGSVGALMSGSGSTIFGFFKEDGAAKACYEYMKSKYEEVFITKTI